MNKNYFTKFICCLATFLFSLLTLSAIANPMGGSVAAGSISIQQAPSTTTINQSSSHGIINWQSFNINTNESTHFNQPVGGVTLNRISPLQGASQIYGRLTATGQIILINSAGIYFGPNSYVNVGGLIASTADISDKDFLSGNYHFIQNPMYNGAVVNQGTIISANHGLIALIGNAVQNDGTIQANLGTAIMGSGREFSISFPGDDNISFTVNSGSVRRAVDKNGNSLANGILNNGSISAGHIIVSAQAASGVLDNVINMRGFVEAKTATAIPGGVILSGGSNGVVRVAANINASGTNGGDVKITGEDVILEAPIINISGSVNGGMLETSATHSLQSSGTIVNALGGTGKNGSWLIDPSDLTICASCTTGGSNFLVTDLTNALASTNVTLQTALSGAGNGDIFINTPVTYSSGNSLTLSAYRNIIGNESISNTGSGDVSLIADNSGTGIGTVSFAAGKHISLMGGSVKIYYNPGVFGTQDLIYNNGIGITTPTQYMLVNSETKLAAIENFLGENFALSTNIDATSLGSSLSNFFGSFDGLGHIVSNLSVPLFDINSGSIINLGVSGNVNGRGLLANSNTGSITNAFSTGLVSGTNNVGGLVGSNSGTMSDVESFAAVSGNNNVGGLVGNNSNSINRALAVGNVSGNSNVGGLVGTGNLPTNSFYNSDTTGIAGGNTTADLMTAATYSNWDMTNVWGIIEGKSYPYLLSVYPTTPRVISGQISEFTSYIDNPAWAFMTQTEKNPDWSSLTPIAIAQQEVSLAANGSLIDKTYSGANGSYYFLEANNTIPDNVPILSFLSNSGYKSNAITLAPSGGASLNHLDLPLNTVLVTDNGQLTLLDTTTSFSNYNNVFGTNNFFMSIAQSDLITALGNFGLNILYTATGNNDIQVNSNINFVIAPTTFYRLNGNLTTVHGSITSNGDIEVLPGLPTFDTVGLQTDLGGNIYINNALWPTFTPITTLNLSAFNDIILNGIILGRTGRSAGNLTLSAAYTDQSITTGPGAISEVVVNDFQLLQGKWYQNFLAAPFLRFPNNPAITQIWNYPIFSALSFSINNGVLPASAAEFLRAGGGSGTVADPYIIFDTYGLQGIGSDAATLSASYRLGADNAFQAGVYLYIAAGSVAEWNNGQGFIPIGNTTIPFSGTFDGNNGDPFATGIWDLAINRPNESNVGLFGVTSSSAQIFNLILYESSIVGGNNTGGLVGINNGTINNVNVDQSFVIGSGTNTGTLVGVNNGLISNSGIYSTRTVGINNVGGIAGENNGLIQDSYAANFVGGNTYTGGLAGINNGTIQNSFWDAGATGQKYSTGLNSGTLDHVRGGCLSLYCPFGIISNPVNLSDKKTYLSLADGGYGFVTKSWDFKSTWEIVPGFSYPYSKILYNAAGGLPSVYSGYTGIPNQVLINVTGPASITEVFVGDYGYGNTVTGADGSFYVINADNIIVDGNFVLFDFIGGNASGSVGFIVHTDPKTGFVQNHNNIQLPGTIIPGLPSNSNVGYTQEDILALFAGVPIVDLYNNLFYNISLAATYSNVLYQASKILYINNYNINSALYYQYGLVAQVRSYYNQYGLTLSDLDSLTQFQKYLDSQIVKRYEIKPIGPNYCGR